jgi:hypothetical protein
VERQEPPRHEDSKGTGARENENDDDYPLISWRLCDLVAGMRIAEAILPNGYPGRLPRIETFSVGWAALPNDHDTGDILISSNGTVQRKK